MVSRWKRKSPSYVLPETPLIFRPKSAKNSPADEFIIIIIIIIIIIHAFLIHLCYKCVCASFTDIKLVTLEKSSTNEMSI